MDKILILGGSGLVGSRVIELLSEKFELLNPSHQDLDLARSEDEILQALGNYSPNQILYAGGYTNVDKAEENRDLTFKLNADAVKVIASFAKKLNVPFHYLSTDYVFDGKKSDFPYKEDDKANPIDAVYAKSKRQGEIYTLESNSKNSVLRLIMPYRAQFNKKLDLVRLALNKLKKGEKLFGVVDQSINPVFIDDLSFAIDKILQTRSSGIYHLGATSYTTPEKFLKLIASTFGFAPELVEPITFAEFSKTRAALRPQHTWLDTSKFRSEFGENILHTVIDGLQLMKKQIRII